MVYLVTCYCYAMNQLSYLFKIIFQSILSTSIYPNMWKLANVTPIFKKGDKQLIENVSTYITPPNLWEMF